MRVVFPASGVEMMANVRRRGTSRRISATSGLTRAVADFGWSGGRLNRLIHRRTVVRRRLPTRDAMGKAANHNSFPGKCGEGHVLAATTLPPQTHCATAAGVKRATPCRRKASSMKNRGTQRMSLLWNRRRELTARSGIPAGLVRGGIRRVVRAGYSLLQSISRRPSLRRAGGLPPASPTRVPLDPVMERSSGDRAPPAPVATSFEAGRPPPGHPAA